MNTINDNSVIANDLIVIAENQKKIYETGYNTGKTDGLKETQSTLPQAEDNRF